MVTDDRFATVSKLIPADRVEVQVLVDNVTDQLSTNPASVRSELSGLLKAGMAEWAGESICCAHHGLSLLVTAYVGERPHTVLFDSGPEGYVIERNSRRLGIDMTAIEAVVLSHGHWDHCGGMLKALDMMALHDRDREIRVYVHPGMFRSRALKLSDGQIVPFKNVPSIEELATHGASVISSAMPQVFLNDLFYVSGEIPRVSGHEEGLPNHLCRMQEKAGWEPDPLIMDERFLAVNVKDKGLLVFTACSHAGVINVLTHAQTGFVDTRLYAVMGGFHLSGPGPEKIISDTVRDLGRFRLTMIIPGHCTGWRAVTALVSTFQEGVVVPSAVGKLYSF
jgi:7,8-dihydropterin-6-yl-methyl-4-(beta-D-ribofuranosyl)aminobenzene 5'-phosphate synthase